LINDVAVIIVNYKNPTDTIVCLESLFNNDGPIGQVFVVENGSHDDSSVKMKEWIMNHDKSKKVKLIVSVTNLGFAGGNNLALKEALSNPNFGYFWFLNNDTLVTSDSCLALRKALEENPKIGLVGSKIRYSWDPDRLQGIGGKFNPFFATTKCIGNNEIDIGQWDHHPNIDLPIGASMMASREFVEKVGLMDESYFLYFEEIDWSVRGRKCGFKPHFTPGSVVYHKEGSSIGTSHRPKERSSKSDYFELRNRIRFTAKNHSLFLPSVILGFIPVFINRIRRRQWGRIPLVLKALFQLPLGKEKV
jgi:GT2 family glycosyltransferase